MIFSVKFNKTGLKLNICINKVFQGKSLTWLGWGHEENNIYCYYSNKGYTRIYVALFTSFYLRFTSLLHNFIQNYIWTMLLLWRPFLKVYI